ncbi:MAG: hypothetical protein IJ874_09135 [Ruminococcus sp.]|nr:hypothetical protein [Ruminococcus sp.]
MSDTFKFSDDLKITKATKPPVHSYEGRIKRVEVLHSFEEYRNMKHEEGVIYIIVDEDDKFPQVGGENYVI